MSKLFTPCMYCWSRKTVSSPHTGRISAAEDTALRAVIFMTIFSSSVLLDTTFSRLVFFVTVTCPCSSTIKCHINLFVYNNNNNLRLNGIFTTSFCPPKTNNSAAHYGILLAETLPYLIMSQWHHQNHTFYSVLNYLQNLYFGIFTFWKLTQWHCFVACPGGAIASVAVCAAWLRWLVSLNSRPRLAESLCQVIAACASRLNSQRGTEGSMVSSLICDRWLMLDLETLSISRCLNHW